MLSNVNGDFDAMTYVAAAGVVPLRMHLLADNTDTIFTTEFPGSDDGGAGARRLPRFDDDGGGGNPAIL